MWPSRAPLVLLSMFCGCAATTPRVYGSFDDVQYGYELERTVWAKRAKLNVRVAELGTERSDRTPIVLLHPWGFSMAVWRDVAPALASARRVILIDLPGHGKSDKLHGAYSMRRLAAAVVDALDELGIARAYLAGNSLGGATSLAVAELAPERVAGLVLIAAPGGRVLPEPLRRAAHGLVGSRSLSSLSDLAWTVGLAVAQRSSSQSAARLRDDLIALRGAREWSAWSRATITILRAVAEYHPDLSGIRMRALVIHGAADLLITRDASDALADGLPNAELIALDACGHMPQVECPAQLVAALAPFLSE